MSENQPWKPWPRPWLFNKGQEILALNLQKNYTMNKINKLNQIPEARSPALNDPARILPYTQHQDALRVADVIRSFKDRHPNDAERMLGEYADLFSERDKEIAKLKEEISDLKSEQNNLSFECCALEDNLNAARIELGEAEDKIAELKSRLDEEE